LASQQILEKEKKLLDAFLKKTKQKSLFEIYFWHKLFRN